MHTQASTTAAPIVNAKSSQILKIAKLPYQCAKAEARRCGWEDKRNGLGFRIAYETLPKLEQYAYERGRLQATLFSAHLRTGQSLPVWPANRHLRPLCYAAFGHTVATAVFAETMVGRT